MKGGSMKISDLLTVSSIDVDASASSKLDALKQGVSLMMKTGAVKDEKAYLNGVLEREKESTTGIGEGVAIPHAKGDFVAKPALIAMVFHQGVEFASLDGEPAKVMFMIAAPKSNGQDNQELEVLQTLSKLLMNEQFVSDLLQAKDSVEFLNIIAKAEGAKLIQEKKIDEEIANTKTFDILGVTSCPNGIAHTYMAQDGLIAAAKKAGLSIKVETDGAAGIEHALTAEEIKAAKAIIVAADASVEMTRFNGKKVLAVSVSKAINNADELIKLALSADTPIYHSDAAAAKPEGDSALTKESIWHKIYKYLMGGVSHMIPFVIAGGFLTAIAFLIDMATGHSDAGASFGSTNVVAAWFKTLGGFSMGLMLPVLAGFIAYSIAGTPALVVGFVAGLLAGNKFSIADTLKLETNGATAGFLGALVGGFIAGYIVLGLKWLTRKMPKNLEGLKSMLIFPIVGTALIGVTMYVVNTPFIYVSFGLQKGLKALADAHLTVLLCAILAGMMAVDMGGPVNKAAYVTGTGLIASALNNELTGEAANAAYMAMAAVMIGGMVPPLAIALAADLFPGKWSKKERTDSKVNYLLGLGFITEGAIPYAASHPLPVIGSSVIGSVVAGILSGVFQVGLPVPHGGIFVFPVLNQGLMNLPWIWYIIALIAGTVVGALCLGIFMPDNPNPELKKWKGLFHVNIDFSKLKKGGKSAEKR